MSIYVEKQRSIGLPVAPLYDTNTVLKEASIYAFPMNSTSNKSVESGGMIHEPEIVQDASVEQIISSIDILAA